MSRLDLKQDVSTFQPLVARLTGKRIGLVPHLSKKSRRMSANDQSLDHVEGVDLDFAAGADSLRRKMSNSRASKGSVGRAGKSRFVKDDDGDVCSVEEMVKFRLAETRPEYGESTLPKIWGLENLDEKADYEFLSASKGGGWHG
jgi:hypothetical protein